MNLHIDSVAFASADRGCCIGRNTSAHRRRRESLAKAEAAQTLGVSPSTLVRPRRDAGLFWPEALKAWPGAREEAGR
jgi:hypothetical protein